MTIELIGKTRNSGPDLDVAMWVIVGTEAKRAVVCGKKNKL